MRLTWWITSSKEHIKELFRWNIRLKVSIVWAVSGRMSSLFLTLIVLSPFVNIAQNSVRVANSCWKVITWSCYKLLSVSAILTLDEFNRRLTFKRLCCPRSAVLIWMEFQSKFSVRSLQFILWGIFRHPENFIKVFTLFYPVQRAHDYKFQSQLQSIYPSRKEFILTNSMFM